MRSSSVSLTEHIDRSDYHSLRALIDSGVEFRTIPVSAKWRLEASSPDCLISRSFDQRFPARFITYLINRFADDHDWIPSRSMLVSLLDNHDPDHDKAKIWHFRGDEHLFHLSKVKTLDSLYTIYPADARRLCEANLDRTKVPAELVASTSVCQLYIQNSLERCNWAITEGEVDRSSLHRLWRLARVGLDTNKQARFKFHFGLYRDQTTDEVRVQPGRILDAGYSLITPLGFLLSRVCRDQIWNEAPLEVGFFQLAKMAMRTYTDGSVLRRGSWSKSTELDKFLKHVAITKAGVPEVICLHRHYAVMMLLCHAFQNPTQARIRILRGFGRNFITEVILRLCIL